MRRLATALVALSFVLLAAAPAAASAPMDLSDRITDEAGALPADDSSVRAAVEAVSADSDADLYVVFVPSFDAEDADVWAEETAARSELEETDVLLAVASGDDTYEYSWWMDDSSPLSGTELEERIDSEVVPALDAGTWDAAVIAMADQVQSLAGGPERGWATWSAGTTMSVVGGLAVVLVAAHLFSRRRSRVQPVG